MREDIRQRRAFDKAIRNMKSLSAEELKQQGIDSYNKSILEEDKLIAAVKEGRATKPEQIKKAKAIEAARNKNKAKNPKIEKEKEN